jgi:hypothetical protein
VSNVRHLAGNFNFHLRDTLVLFADEVEWFDDPQAAGVLKMLITEPELPIEPKGRNVFMVKNMLSNIIASNSNWIVPADLDDRRFFVLDVSDKRVGDGAYFGAIAEQMERGGRECRASSTSERSFLKLM